MNKYTPKHIELFRTSNHEKGLTLIELLVSVTLSSIVLALGFMAFSLYLVTMNKATIQLNSENHLRTINDYLIRQFRQQTELTIDVNPQEQGANCSVVTTTERTGNILVQFGNVSIKYDFDGQKISSIYREASNQNKQVFYDGDWIGKNTNGELVYLKKIQTCLTKQSSEASQDIATNVELMATLSNGEQKSFSTKLSLFNWSDALQNQSALAGANANAQIQPTFAPGTVLTQLKNGGFEKRSLTGWSVRADASNCGTSCAGVDNQNGPRNGYKLWMYKATPFKNEVYQTIMNLPNDTYTIAAWISLNQPGTAKMKLSDFGGSEQNIPIYQNCETAFGSDFEYALYVGTAQVTNHQLTISFLLDATTNQTTLKVDDIRLIAGNMDRTPLIANNSFAGMNTPIPSATNNGWFEWHPSGQALRAGIDQNGALNDFKAYLYAPNTFEQAIHQKVSSGLVSGTYTIGAWTKTNNNAGTVSRMELRNQLAGDCDASVSTYCVSTYTNQKTGSFDRWAFLANKIDVFGSTPFLQLGFYVKGAAKTSLAIDEVKMYRGDFYAPVGDY